MVNSMREINICNICYKRPLGKPKRRLKDNIKMDLQEMGCRSTDWIELGQDTDRLRTLVNALMSLLVP